MAILRTADDALIYLRRVERAAGWSAALDRSRAASGIIAAQFGNARGRTVTIDAVKSHRHAAFAVFVTQVDPEAAAYGGANPVVGVFEVGSEDAEYAASYVKAFLE